MSRSRAAAVWLAASAITLLVAWGTRIGPIVVELSYRHGIHLGDLLTGCAAGAAAAYVTTPRPVRPEA